MARSMLGGLSALAFVLLMTSSCSSESIVETEEFPKFIEIREGNWLVVYGRVFTDTTLELTWDGHVLKAEEWQIWPRLQLQPKPIPESRLQERYGDIPLVAERVRQGDTYAEAVDRFQEKLDEVIKRVRSHYWDVIEAGGTREQAGEAAINSVRDDDFLSEPPAHVGNAFVFKIQGLERGITAYLGRERGTPPSDPEATNRMHAMGLADRIETFFNRPGPCLFIIGDIILEGQSAPLAAEQIERALSGEITDGPLPTHQIERILREREEVQP